MKRLINREEFCHGPASLSVLVDIYTQCYCYYSISLWLRYLLRLAFLPRNMANTINVILANTMLTNGRTIIQSS